MVELPDTDVNETVNTTQPLNAQNAAALNAASSGVAATTATTTPQHIGPTNRLIIAVIVYFALLLDNVLLTVIVPILPDYLASINNRTYHSSMDISSRAAVNSFGPGVSAHSMAYRNLDTVPQPPQAIITKHPIPGKSMVNFSLLHAFEDKGLIVPNIDAIGQQQMQAIDSQKTRSKSFVPSFSEKSSRTRIRTGAAIEDTLTGENGSIGILLAMKALVQLIFNPIVGSMSSKFGYRLLIVIGTFFLLVSSLVFAVGETYGTLLIARAVQGIGSACISICGMSLVAQLYPEEERRSKIMGIILGSIALGVLLGYPIGGILYDLIDKSAPFIILSTILFLNLGLQLLTMDLSVQPEVVLEVDQVQKPKWTPLLESKMILAIFTAIWFSTSTMAILEPCLPIWLMQNLKPNKWQLGTVFIPDSVGYFVGTNFFGSIAYKYGQIRVTCLSLMLVGISAIMIPSAATVWQLLLPHFGLGLGIGIVDAALVPLLATIVDAQLSNGENENENSNENSSTYPMSSYGTVYAIQQTSVSLAYCLAPLLGGELAQYFGFAWLMRIVGSFNVIYGPILILIYKKYDPKILNEKRNQMLLSNSAGSSQYKKLYNSVDVE